MSRHRVGTDPGDLIGIFGKKTNPIKPAELAIAGRELVLIGKRDHARNAQSLQGPRRRGQGLLAVTQERAKAQKGD